MGGILTLDGASTIKGTIGVSGTQLAAVNVANSATGTDLFQGDIYANAINIANGGTAELAGGVSYNSGDTAAASRPWLDTGVLTLDGASTIKGTIGVSGTQLAAVNVANLGIGTDLFQGAIYANAINIAHSGTAELANGVSYNSGDTAGAITGAGGYLTLDGASTIKGTIGVSGTQLAAVNVANLGIATDLFQGAIYANAINIANGGTAELANGISYNAGDTLGAITGLGGILTLDGTSTIKGTIGVSGTQGLPRHKRRQPRDRHRSVQGRHLRQCDQYRQSGTASWQTA